MITKLRQVLSLICYTINTVFWFVPIMFCGFLKLLPLKAWQRTISRLAKYFASCWVGMNSRIQNVFSPYKIIVEGLENLKQKDWYLVIANHQSWVDIMVLQRLFHKRIPFLNFFLKKQLIYVPFLGLAWWALDFPFMQRSSKEQIKKNPSLKGKDIATTKKACEKFKQMPVSIVNFIEGTRFTPSKHQKQNSPFDHLLKPKAGGVAFVMQAMGEQISKIVNVTIHYPGGIPSFMDFAAGKMKQVKVHVEVLPIAKHFIGDYANDQAFRVAFQQELNQLWTAKDKQFKLLTAKDV